MSTLQEFDREIRRLTGEQALSRPFLCDGLPVGCEVGEVGINPGTPTPFWPYWNTNTGCDKEGWLADFSQRHPGRKPTRENIEVLCQALSPLRLLELNLHHRFSPNEASLAKEHRTTEVFDLLLETVKPRVLLVHGNTPIEYLSRLLDVSIQKDQFTSAIYLGSKVEVFAAKRHFAYVSRDYVVSIAGLIKERVRRLKA